MTSNVSALSGCVANGQQAIHFVRRVFPNTVGSAVFYRMTFGPQTFDIRSVLCQSLAFVQAFLSPFPGPSPYCGHCSIADHTHRPLAQHDFSFLRLQTRLRPDAPV